ncbi:TPA: helix-turn-helix transcriptional regulator [Klebsiella aerogenes]|nr:helix-turn-helix transcriptional regulator [Klebsiella aerogenes]HDN2728364.1 helix-turn-helix transcriptional regulator [Klebsiella aerogenes]
MFSKHTHICSERYDLWIDNHFLMSGISLILRTLPESCFRKKHVFFTSDSYFSVLQHKYNRRETIFILLTEGNDLNFLSELPMIRIPARSTPAELKTFLNQPTRYYKSHTSPGELIQFTEREKKVIQLISNGEAIASIGRSLNLHIKTIYQIRLNLIKKLGCSGRTDFFNISRSETFKSWSQIHL